MTTDEARDFLRAVKGGRHEAVWTTILMLGLRRSEVCGLRWEHVDFVNRSLRIAQSVQRVEGELRVMPTKSRRSNRTVPLPGRALYALAQHHSRVQRRTATPGRPGRTDGNVFGTANDTALDPRNLTRMFGLACQHHGIRVVRLHDLRHTCVSLLLALGVHPRVVMEIVGHSAIEMTMNVCGHVNIETQRQALDGLDSALGD
jgi:integrase